MRIVRACLLVLLVVTESPAQDAKKLNHRYGVEVDLTNYSQATGKDALASVLKAIDRKRVDYLVAHLADPDFVDQRVKAHGGKFEEMVRETTGKLVEDPEALKLLRRFLSEGEWEADDKTAYARLKGVKKRVYFRKLEERWFLENRQDAGEK